MRTHWKKILLLIVLAVLANRGMAANVAVWPDAGGGSNSGTIEFGSVAFSGNLVALQTLTTLNQWDPLDMNVSGSIDFALRTTTPASFDEPVDGQLRYIGATTRKFFVVGGLSARPSTTSANTVMQVRIAKSTDGGSTWSAVIGTSGVRNIRWKADTDISNTPSMADLIELAPNDILRLEVRAPTSGGSTGNFYGVDASLAAVSTSGADGADGADADFATDGATNENVLAGRALVSTEASSTTLTTLDMSGSIITNTGAAGSVTYTLGTATCSAGMQFTVLNAEDGQPIVLDPFSTVDQIINLTDAAGDSVTSDGVNTSAISCQCIATGDWFCTRSGSWTDTD